MSLSFDKLLTEIYKVFVISKEESLINIVCNCCIDDKRLSTGKLHLASAAFSRSQSVHKKHTCQVYAKCPNSQLNKPHLLDVT